MKNSERSKKQPLFKYLLFGAGIGIINGLFGAGGGMLAVLAYIHFFGMETKKAHANALCIMLPFTVVSIILYATKDTFELFPLPFVVPAFFVGSMLGAKLLSKIATVWVNRVFYGLMVVAAVWLILLFSLYAVLFPVQSRAWAWAVAQC